MDTAGISLHYQGLRVYLQDQPGRGRDALGPEDIAEVRLVDGTVVQGAELATQLEDPGFAAQVIGVIDAYGPVVSIPFHQPGSREWQKILRFWGQAQPDFWLRYLTNNPAEAERRDFALREEFGRANRSRALPPALQEAVAVHQMLGRIRRLYQPSLGVKRFDSLVDQKTIDEHLIGPVVRQFPQAVTALVQQRGHTPLTDAILATTAWQDKALQSGLPQWAREFAQRKQVIWLLDEKGLAGLEELFRTPQLIIAHAEQVIAYCWWLEILPRDAANEARFDRIFRIAMRAAAIFGTLPESNFRPSLLEQLLTIFDGLAIEALSPQQCLEAFFLKAAHRTLAWGHWIYAYSARAESGILSTLEKRWRTGSDVQAMAEALLARYGTDREYMHEHREYFLTLALHLHNKLPTAEGRAPLGAMILSLLDSEYDFSTLYRLAAQAQLLVPTGEQVETLFQRRFAAPDPDVQAAARYARWMSEQPPLPEGIAFALELVEHRELSYAGVYEDHLRVDCDAWFAALTPEGAKVIADQLLAWWHRTAEHAYLRKSELKLNFFYRIHNRLTDPNDRDRIGALIESELSSPRVFGLEYPWVAAYQLAEPTQTRLTALLERRLQDADPFMREQAELAHMLSARRLPHILNQALRLANPDTLEYRWHNDTDAVVQAVTNDPWFTTLSPADVTLLMAHLEKWHQERRNVGWRGVHKQAEIRLSLFARIHNQTTDHALRARIADIFVDYMQTAGRYYSTLRLARKMRLQEPAASQVWNAFALLKTRTDLATRRAVVEIDTYLIQDFLRETLLARGAPGERTARLAWSANVESESFVFAVYPLLTAPERSRLDAVIIAILTFALPGDTEWIEQQQKIRAAFFPILAQVSPALRAMLETR